MMMKESGFEMYNTSLTILTLDGYQGRVNPIDLLPTDFG